MFPEQLYAVSPATLRARAKAQTCQTQTVAGNPSLLYHIAENTARELDRSTIGKTMSFRAWHLATCEATVQVWAVDPHATRIHRAMCDFQPLLDGQCGGIQLGNAREAVHFGGRQDVGVHSDGC